MSKYQIFTPGKYLEWEKEIIEERFELAAKGPPKGRSGPDIVKEDELIRINHTWEPYNPLFNNKDYAQKAGYQDVPALPATKRPMSAHRILRIGEDITEKIDVIRYGGHGPDDVEMFAPIYPGDSLYTEHDKIMFEEFTMPDSTIRLFKFGGTSKMYNQKGDLVVRSTNWLRHAYRKIIDGSPRPTGDELYMMDRAPSVPHYTTDEEWEYIKELWNKEYIRGSNTLYWEDVNIGDEPAWSCSGPISYMDIIRWHPIPGLQLVRDLIMSGNTAELERDKFGQYLTMGLGRHYGGLNKNVPGARALFYNNDAAMHVLRMITNYIGDAGFVTRFGWMFQQTQKGAQYPQEGGEYLDKVPYMKGKACTVHGWEGDTVIGKGYVTDKYINDNGEHSIDLVCWAETLDNRIIEVVPAAAKLPSKKK